MIKIGTDPFWDGGIVSNTPLQHLLDHEGALNTRVFQVDLFGVRGDIQDVMARHKDIMCSSRTRYTTDLYRRLHKWKTRLLKTLGKVPPELLTARSAGSMITSRDSADHHPSVDLSAEGL